MSASQVMSSQLQARAKQRIAEDMRRDFEHDRDKLKKVSGEGGPERARKVFVPTFSCCHGRNTSGLLI